ncbi:MAG: 3-phosphoshikimate 1-carboxyvinyltransferase [Acidobacteria bacterium]|nr:3-phosphoshikimate 1-carboxyvinyltransferase [Acidobacteriota bacterium]
MKIKPAMRISGRVSVPGDKSISHRAAIIAALAEGPSRLTNYSTSQDCASTLSCLRGLGVSIQQQNSEVLIGGRGMTGLNAATMPLDCGNSGSTMRMLAGVLAGQSFDSLLTGDASLCSRPMKRIVEPLSLMGSSVHATDNRPPLRIEGSKTLQPIHYVLPVASAQVKSCILLAALKAQGRTEVVERLGPTRDHTERMLRWFGVPLETQAGVDGAITIAINGPVSYAARDVNIPGDISSAAFLIGVAAVLPDSQLRIDNVGLNATRSGILTLLSSLGFAIEIRNPREDCNEPKGDILISGKVEKRPADSNRPPRVAGPLIAPLIDELPLLAVMGSQLAGGLEIRDAGELRLKETDRIAATVNNLRAMGALVEEFEDGLAVTGPTALKGAPLDSFGDHRIAMAFTVGALLANDDSELTGADCVAVSFPEFFSLLDSVVQSRV